MHSVTTSVRASPFSALIRVRGEVDLLAEPDLRRATAIVVDGRCDDVLLDTNDVSFLDCAGLEALMSCREGVAASGGQLRLGRTSPAVSRLLTMTRSRGSWATASTAEVWASCRPTRPTRPTVTAGSGTTAGLVAGSARVRRWTGQPRHPNCWTALREPAGLVGARHAAPPDSPRG